MNKEYWELPIAELSESLLQQISGLLHKYSTGLIKVYSDQWEEPEIALIGAGTFVSIGDIYGVLTAYHVSVAFEPGDQLGFTLQEQEQHFSIPVEHLTFINIAIPEDESLGPDMAFICIPDHYLGTIKAHRSFYDLSSNKEDLLENNLNKRDLCFVCGTIGNRTTEEESDKGFERVIGVHGYCGASGIEQSFSADEYDYLDVGIEYHSDDDIPKTFSGMSGGGIWLVPLVKDEVGEISMKEHKYCGVVFYQTERVGNSRLLRGHGPKSVFGVAVDAILDYFEGK